MTGRQFSTKQPDRRRRQNAAAAKRRRDRVRNDQQLFTLELQQHDVAAALLAMRLCGPEADLVDRGVSTPILQELVQSFLAFVTDDSAHKVLPGEAVKLRSLSEK